MFSTQNTKVKTNQAAQKPKPTQTAKPAKPKQQTKTVKSTQQQSKSQNQYKVNTTLQTSNTTKLIVNKIKNQTKSLLTQPTSTQSKPKAN